jgi:hypothetical protein
MSSDFREYLMDEMAIDAATQREHDRELERQREELQSFGDWLNNQDAEFSFKAVIQGGECYMEVADAVLYLENDEIRNAKGSDYPFRILYRMYLER